MCNATRLDENMLNSSEVQLADKQKAANNSADNTVKDGNYLQGHKSLQMHKSSSVKLESFCILLHKNSSKGAKRKPKELIIKTNVSLAKVKRACGKELKLKAKRLFQVNGDEVQFLDEIQAGSVLFASQGEPFFRARKEKTRAREVNIAVLGRGAVGKSALTLRYVRNFFVNFWDPTVEDAYQKSVQLDGKVFKLNILDTAGQDNFESLRAQWMADKDGYLFVYDMTDLDSLKALAPYVQLYRQLHIQSTRRVIEPIPIVICANKKDVVAQDPGKEQVSTNVGKSYAQKWGAHYMETSAKTGENVTKAFEYLLRKHNSDTKGQVEHGLSFCSIL